jgi:hypothetical protein
MSDTSDTEKPVVTIKVTDGPNKAYFVRFDRDSCNLIDVFEYKKIYTPGTWVMPSRTKIIVDLARSRIGMPREIETTTTGEQQ